MLAISPTPSYCLRNVKPRDLHARGLDDAAYARSSATPSQRPWRSGIASLWLGLLLACVARGGDADPKRPPLFERDVWPIIADHCVSCHGADAPKAGLDLRTVSRMHKGGESGPALDRADHESSLLLERIARHEMPPGKARKLSETEVSVFRAGSAEEPRRPPRSHAAADFANPRPRSAVLVVPAAIPAARARDVTGNARTADRCLLAREDGAEGPGFSPDADAATLAAPGVARFAGPAPFTRGGRCLHRRRPTRMPSSDWSTGCWPRRTLASAGAATGWTWRAMSTRSASTPTRPTSSSARASGSIATM